MSSVAFTEQTRRDATQKTTLRPKIVKVGGANPSRNGSRPGWALSGKPVNRHPELPPPPQSIATRRIPVTRFSYCLNRRPLFWTGQNDGWAQGTIKKEVAAAVA